MTFGPDVAAMTLNDSLDGCQTDSETFELRRGVKPLEWCEESFRASHVETSAIVSNKECAMTVFAELANLDSWVSLVAAEFPRIANQVLQHEPQQALIAMRFQIGLDNKADIAFRCILAQ